MIKIALDEGALLPTRGYKTDAGLDLRTPYATVIPAHGSVTIDTGVHVQIPASFCGMLVSKSGLNVNKNIVSTGLIDHGYTGSIVAKLYNMGSEPQTIKRGDKITQLVIVPCLIRDLEIVDTIDGGERGNNGFGSTGA